MEEETSTEPPPRSRGGGGGKQKTGDVSSLGGRVPFDPATSCADRPFERGGADFLINSCESCTITRPTLEYLYLTFLPARGSVSRAASPPPLCANFSRPAGRTTAHESRRFFFFGRFFLMLKVDFFCGKGENK